MNNCVDYKDLPYDLWPENLKEEYFKNNARRGITKPVSRSEAPPDVTNALYLSRAFQGVPVTVGNTATKILSNERTWPYLFLNPTRVVGITKKQSAYSGTADDGDVTVSFGVADYKEAHIHIDVTTIGTSAWDLFAESYDNVSTNWATTQVVFSGISAIGTTYSYVGSLGIATDMRFKFSRTSGTGTVTCTVSVILKDGQGGSSAGLAQTIYIGGSGVTITSGYPILEGDQQTFLIGENIDVYAISNVPVVLNMFKL